MAALDLFDQHQPGDRGRSPYRSSQGCAVVLVGDATELVSRETAERVEGVGLPPARELFQKLLDNQVPVYV